MPVQLPSPPAVAPPSFHPLVVGMAAPCRPSRRPPRRPPRRGPPRGFRCCSARWRSTFSSACYRPPARTRSRLTPSEPAPWPPLPSLLVHFVILRSLVSAPPRSPSSPPPAPPHLHPAPRDRRSPVASSSSRSRCRYTPLHTVTHRHTPLHTVTHRYRCCAPSSSSSHAVTHRDAPSRPVTPRHAPSRTVTHRYTPLHTVTHRSRCCASSSSSPSSSSSTPPSTGQLLPPLAPSPPAPPRHPHHPRLSHHPPHQVAARARPPMGAVVPGDAPPCLAACRPPPHHPRLPRALHTVTYRYIPLHPHLPRAPAACVVVSCRFYVITECLVRYALPVVVACRVHLIVDSSRVVPSPRPD